MLQAIWTQNIKNNIQNFFSIHKPCKSPDKLPNTTKLHKNNLNLTTHEEIKLYKEYLPLLLAIYNLSYNTTKYPNQIAYTDICIDCPSVNAVYLLAINNFIRYTQAP